MPPLPELTLLEEAVGSDPLKLFALWFAEAQALPLLEPAAMVLATCTPTGQPSARVVLLRSFDEGGFVFYTNYQSRKGAELAANPRAALTLYWDPVRRQIRIEGKVEKLTPAESDLYFSARPVGHQLSALISAQSEIVPDRLYLESALAEQVRLHEGKIPVRPAWWGGYRVVPHQFEFWQGRDNRLHDRLRYRLAEGGKWLCERLAP